MRGKETILAIATVGAFSFAGLGVVEMRNNWDVGLDHSDWNDQKGKLTSNLVASLPQNLSQTTPAEQAGINSIREKLLNIDQKFDTDTRSENASGIGTLLFSFGVLSGGALGGVTFIGLSDRKRRESRALTANQR